MKDEGNKLFVQGKFKLSLDKYKEALLLVDLYDEKSTFSLLLANRSANYFNLKEYRLCLEDICTALENNYPQNLHLKLFERRAKCFHFLGEKLEFDKELVNIKNLDYEINPEEKVHKVISGLKSLKWNFKLPSSKCETRKSPRTQVKDKNQDFEGFSDVAKMQFTEQRGRFMTSSEDISVGTIIGAENPVLSMLLPDKSSSQCYNCFSVIVDYFLPCLHCTKVRYCSRSCWKSGDKSHHRLECGVETELGEVLRSVKGGDSTPDYYKLCLLAIGSRSPEEVVGIEMKARTKQNNENIPSQKESNIMSLFNLVRSPMNYIQYLL